MDLGDKCNESCGAVDGAGGVFGGARPVAAVSRSALPACECGGRPAYGPHPPLRSGGPQLETLACGACGNSVGPFASRQVLATAWRLGGYRRDR